MGNSKQAAAGEEGDGGELARAPLERMRDPSRVLALSDGVFAIIMTLLVLDIRVPQLAEGGSLAAFTSESGSRSSASASADFSPVEVCEAARASCQSSICSVPERCGSRRRLRQVLMKALVRIRNSHAFRLVPCWNWRNDAYAFAKVSCTRSSASAGLRVIRTAAAYNWSR